MRLTDVCIRNPVLAWMLLAAVVVSGLVSGSRIGISQFPDIDAPVIAVRVGWEAAAPEVIETDVTDVLEEAFTQIEGVRSIRSSSRQGGASITVELDVSRDVDAAFQDVQARVSQVQSRLPRDIDPPVITKSNPDDQPIMHLALSGFQSRQALSDYARYRVKEQLQTVPGVGEIELRGWLERNVRVWLDQERLDARNLTVAEVTRALARQHVEMPAGQLIAGGREVNVRVLGEALELGTLRRLVVAEQGGAPIRLEDVALVEDGFEDERGLARVDGEPCLILGIKKIRGANAVAVADGIHRAVDSIVTTLPAGMHLVVNSDHTRHIRESVHELMYELCQAVILTAVLCWLFLGSLSSTLNVVLAIPMSLLGTVTVLYFCGYTLNIFTLLGLGLAVGIVVDDAIMVLENITRHREEGAEKLHAARFGTREIAFAALASTIAVVAVFSPVLFISGMQGRFFLQFGIALCVAILISYVEAVTLTPSRCAQFLEVDSARRTMIGRAADVLFAAGERAYARVLRLALARPLITLLVMGVFFAGSLVPLLQNRIPKELVPSQDQSKLYVRMNTAMGSSLAETDQLVKRAEALVMARPEVQRTLTFIGLFGGVNSGFLVVMLKPPEERDLTQLQVMDALRKELRPIAGLESALSDPSTRTFTSQRGYPVEVSLRGPDWDALMTSATALKERMRESGLFTDVDSDAKLGMPELHILPDRERCADLGVAVEDVADSINALVGGVRVGKYTDGGRRMWIRCRLLADQRTRPEDLAGIRLRTASGALVPLASLITTRELPAQQTIYRADRERAVTIFASPATGHAQQECLDWMRTSAASLPAGCRLVFTGTSQVMQESSHDMIFALIGGVLAAYMVLAAQFNSFLHPITVLMVLPLSISGAVLALWFTGQSLNMFSVIGILLLMGIAKKNSIILVDYTNQLRGPKHALYAAQDALLKAGPVRLRPILMTSLATMAAAVPLAIGVGPGGEIRRPMATAVIGGVFISTILSLVVVPAFYLVVDRTKAWIYGKVWGAAEADAVRRGER